jgi:hypothetical protein
MKVFEKLASLIIGSLLGFTLLSCSGGGGGGNSSATVIAGRVADGYVVGATVTAYQVNANGTLGAQIGTSVTTDSNGDYTLNLGTYSGPVYLTSVGGTYIDTVTGSPIDLTTSSMVLSAIVANASGNVTAQINPFTTMAAGVALTLVSQGTSVASAADQANTLIQDYFAIASPILNTALVSLTTPSCMDGYTQPSADESAILAGISQLASDNGVSSLDLVEALVQDVTSDGQFDGLASKVTISVPLTPGPGTVALSVIEGPALTNLASAITTFMTNTTTLNVCGATVDSSVISALSVTSIITTPAPAAPTGVNATPQLDGSVLISWNPVTGATSYNIYMATSTGVTPTSTQLPGFRSVPNMKNTSADISGPTNTYYFVVTAASGTYPYVNESVPSAQVSASITATVLPALWAETVSAGTGTSASDFNGVSVASDGSVYAAGDIYGTGSYDFGSGVIPPGTNDSSNVVLVKYNSSGIAQWARTVTAGSDKSSFSSVAAALDGSVYAAGYIYGTGTYDFGNGKTAAGTYTGSNAVLVKYNSSGVAQWAQTVMTATPPPDMINQIIQVSAFSGVSVASDGSVYAAGYIYGTGTYCTYNFGNGVTAMGPSNGYNPVLVKYNSSGVAQWARTVTATSLTGIIDESAFNGVSVASDGSVYTAGYIAGDITTTTFNFGNNVTATGVYSAGNIVLVKYDSTGLAQWARTVTAGLGDSLFTSVSALAADGSVYAAGYIQGNGTYNFDTSVTATGASADGINVILVKYDSSGTVQQAHTVTGGSGSSDLFGVSATSDGSVYTSGFIDGTVAYGFGNSVTAQGVFSGENILLVKYDSLGNTSWAQTVTVGNNASFFNGVSAGSGGYAYAAGDILGTGTYNFGSGVTATGTYGGSNLVLVGY